MLEGFQTTRIEVNGVGLHVVHGGTGPAVLLLHGYPQTHVMWHKVAPDMRGCGDSDKPKAAPGDHAVYCKRTTANDLVAMMDALGHDRGARIAHRMALSSRKSTTRDNADTGRRRGGSGPASASALVERDVTGPLASRRLVHPSRRRNGEHKKFLHRGAWSQCRNFPPYNFVPPGRAGCP